MTGIVAAVQGAAKGSTPFDMAFEALVNSIFWATVIGAVQAWRHRKDPTDRSRGRQLAQKLNESGPLTATDRAVWQYLRPLERVLLKSNAGAVSYRHVTDGALYVTTERLVFVVLKDLAVLEVPRDSEVVVGRTTRLNGFVHLGDVEFVMPSREIPALQSAVLQLQTESAAPASRASYSTSRSTPADVPGAAPAKPTNADHVDSDDAEPRRASGMWVAAGAVGLCALLAISASAERNEGSASASSQTTAAEPSSPPAADTGLYVGSCLKPYGSDQVITADCMDPSVYLVVTKLAANAIECARDPVTPIHLPDGRYACLMQRG